MTEQPQEQSELTSPEGRAKLEEVLLDGRLVQQTQRRWALMRITPDAVVQLASGMLRVSYPGPIPHGAQVIGQAWAPLLQMFELIIEHESFARVPVGEDAPPLPLLTFEVDAAGNSKSTESEVRLRRAIAGSGCE